MNNTLTDRCVNKPNLTHAPHQMCIRDSSGLVHQLFLFVRYIDRMGQCVAVRRRLCAAQIDALLSLIHISTQPVPMLN